MIIIFSPGPRRGEGDGRDDPRAAPREAAVQAQGDGDGERGVRVKKHQNATGKKSSNSTREYVQNMRTEKYERVSSPTITNGLV